MAIDGGVLTLPSGKFENLELKEGGPGSTISVNVAERDTRRDWLSQCPSGVSTVAMIIEAIEKTCTCFMP